MRNARPGGPSAPPRAARVRHASSGRAAGAGARRQAAVRLTRWPSARLGFAPVADPRVHAARIAAMEFKRLAIDAQSASRRTRLGDRSGAAAPTWARRLAAALRSRWAARHRRSSAALAREAALRRLRGRETLALTARSTRKTTERRTPSWRRRRGSEARPARRFRDGGGGEACTSLRRAQLRPLHSALSRSPEGATFTSRTRRLTHFYRFDGGIEGAVLRHRAAASLPLPRGVRGALATGLGAVGAPADLLLSNGVDRALGLSQWCSAWSAEIGCNLQARTRSTGPSREALSRRARAVRACPNRRGNPRAVRRRLPSTRADRSPSCALGKITVDYPNN